MLAILTLHQILRAFKNYNQSKAKVVIKYPAQKKKEGEERKIRREKRAEIFDKTNSWAPRPSRKLSKHQCPDEGS